MIGSSYTITNKANPTLTFNFNDHVTDPDNFIALQVYPTMDLEIRNEEIEKEGQHGIWDFFSFYGKRQIIFEGVIVGANEGECHRMKELMQRVTYLPNQPETANDGTVTILWTDPLGRDVQIEAKLAASIRFSRPLKYRNRLDFIMQLKSPNPIIEGQDLIEESGTRSWEMGSFRLPVVLPAPIEVIRLNVLTVDNAGSSTADTVVRLYGSTLFPITNPRITNETTSKFMQVNVTLADETEFVVFNSRTGQILDQDNNDLSGDLESGSEFIELNVGENDLYYTSDESDPLNPLNPVADRRTPVAAFEVDYRESIL